MATIYITQIKCSSDEVYFSGWGFEKKSKVLIEALQFANGNDIRRISYEKSERKDLASKFGDHALHSGFIFKLSLAEVIDLFESPTSQLLGDIGNERVTLKLAIPGLEFSPLLQQLPRILEVAKDNFDQPEVMSRLIFIWKMVFELYQRQSENFSVDVVNLAGIICYAHEGIEADLSLLGKAIETHLVKSIRGDSHHISKFFLRLICYQLLKSNNHALASELVDTITKKHNYLRPCDLLLKIICRLVLFLSGEEISAKHSKMVALDNCWQEFREYAKNIEVFDLPNLEYMEMSGYLSYFAYMLHYIKLGEIDKKSLLSDFEPIATRVYGNSFQTIKLELENLAVLDA